ncbi:zinc ribbon domain-containing protein [Eubacterium sp. 1001713B170207_170306_E7]|uniref:zinc-ribbon domain-containing protein n=1 Tax=Eubacterium sp. 1001713B170207_170306_E7 TaxID=2787097 RepID=UPI00189C4DD8|nr:zinc ribbon domain-containing protein [Eubacterium sp. 1001713B170207_170306_E7]
MLNILNCPNCGHEIQKEDQFCGYCGAKLIQEKQEDEAKVETVVREKKQNKNHSDIFRIGGTLVCLVLIMIIINIGRNAGVQYQVDNTSDNNYTSEVQMPAGSTTDEDYGQQEEQTITKTSDPYANAMKEYNDIETVRKQLDYYVNLLPEAVTTEAMGGRPSMSSAEIQMKITELNSKLMSFSGQ